MNTPSVAPRGFVGVTARLGLKDASDDFAAVVSEVPCASAAVFTRSRFAGPSVLLSRADAPAGRSRGIVVISKNANVATGAAGERDAVEVRSTVAAAAGVAPEELVIASTGVIGRRYPMDVVRTGLAALPRPFPAADFGGTAAAIMTTDTRAKQCTVRVGDAVITGIAKGVGMIEPNMATLLTFFFTDAEVPAAELDAVFRRVVDRTFNALSIDTDTSTSDTAAVFANGLAGPVDLKEFEQALYQCALTLVRDIASDGEGASKLIEVRVTGALDAAQAKRAGKVVVNSPLVKTAVHGADPNWGRVVMAIGKLDGPADDRITPDTVTVRFGDVTLYPGDSAQELLDAAAAHLSGTEVVIHVDLGLGDAEFTVYGCDLTEGYVKLNADYTT
ncbi:bifunctional glutamate N-acetyltransferase/amino-acid acetyltransferase ArgJ [Streptomyces sp. NPDC002577]